MIFSELYSAYYNAVAGILCDIIQGRTDEKTMRETIARHAFSESVLTILPALKNEKWQLIKHDMTTPIQNIPSMPLTLLEKRWLKAISADPRIRLFDISFDGLDDVEPLFTQNDYVVYDKYADGDPYADEDYISRFKTILEALREKRPLEIERFNRKGDPVRIRVMPIRLEYSEKDDKFRLIAADCRYVRTLNLARIVSCKQYNGEKFVPVKERLLNRSVVTLKISNERNTLERCMMHFAHFEKQTERIDGNQYLVHIRYDKGDETELVIRILGFGPTVEVIDPDHFRELIIERLQRQKSCGLF